ncbi:WavE lipopolysaccharide synthesis [Pseudomonas sp. HLS-6]|uniref:WavE lipopolysaccharide synthesis family protein n=1 Tax=Pseudomonas sp. HLS-6 TaxID=2049589 RepID=UPI000C198627|nr:WavE lipopolysaccharide synthesis family protein [Pseudomonas sp. HLS-6]ATR84284.1 WavE lipopolysaccharide synthesis [Pseudomonas sp. HLS-6]
MEWHLTPIEAEKISIVIQGPLYRNLSPERGIFACIASIKKHFPTAEIIVSTWTHEDTSGIEADQIVVSEDPGYFLDCSGNQFNSNRMLRSTLSGIQAATRPYVMKFRADHNMTSTSLAVIGEPEHFAPDEPKLFKTPITITTLYIRNPIKVPMLFHISDLVQFGTREDMLSFWNQPLFKENEVFHSRPFRNPFGNFTGYSAAYKMAEQCLMLGAMRMHGIDVHLMHPCQVRISDLKLWESILRINFRVIEYSEAGVDFPERFLSTGFPLRTLYKASEIRQLYRLSLIGYRLKIARIWINQYVLNCFRSTWWVSLASIVLFSTSPTLAKAIRSHWRKLRSVIHPDSGRM